MPNTFVVGAGPVATALAGALRLGGVPVLGLWARKAASARAAGAVAGVAAFSSAPPDLMLEAHVVLVAVRDAAIAEVAQMLVATGLITRHHTLIHCSGVISSDEAFARVRDRVGGVATLHPLRAIPDGQAAMRRMGATVFGVEGDERGRAEARTLATAMGGRVLELVGEQMAAYHAAAAVASNYLVGLLDAAGALLEHAGIPREDGIASLLPLVEGTLSNIRERGPAAALTGPIRRGDVETVERHLAALRGVPADLGELYRALGRRVVALARQSGDVPEDRLDAIEQLLSAPPELRVQVRTAEHTSGSGRQRLR